MNVDHEASLDREVRYCVYDHVMREGLPPTIAQTASTLSVVPDDVSESFRRLADAHVLVLQRGVRGRSLWPTPSRPCRRPSW